MTDGLTWPAIVRLGLVQSAIGATVALTTATLNRVMVVEYGLAATIPAALVAFHYAVQLSRARWGHGSDGGARRTPWIIGGMAVLASGATLAAFATTRMHTPAIGIALAVVAFAMIGVGVGAAGTSLLALLAASVAPARRSAAAAITWIMMIVGIVVSTGIAGQLLDPFSPARLLGVAGGVAAVAFVVAVVGVIGIERPRLDAGADRPDFAAAVHDIWADTRTRRFTVFVFVSMLAYSAQELILEPFAGLLFGFTPGQSTSLASVQHGGVLIGMVGVGIAGNAFSGAAGWMRGWTVAGCLGSAAALAGLACAAVFAPDWPLRPTVFLLGLANGVFAVAAIGSMMGLAGGGGPGREGIRMGVWGAAQAIAFACGGFAGAAGVDVGRRLLGATPPAFVAVFALEAAVFITAAVLALRIDAASRTTQFTNLATEG